MSDKKPVNALLLSPQVPTDEQRQRFNAFLAQKYGEGVTVRWEKDTSIKNGFRLKVGSETYDWSARGRFAQFENALRSVKGQSNVVPLLKGKIEKWVPEAVAEEQGVVQTVGDGIATLSGLEYAEYGEVLLFSSGVRGMVQELDEDRVGCILFGDDAEISAGSIVRRSGRPAGIPVGSAMLGRVVNAMGVPVDGKGDIEAEDFYPVERPAPGIIDRQPVNQAVETGLLTIDSMFPIGRGQRELIIGNRQTGKTAIAIDTIINQKGKDVICIYVAIGQKASSVAQLTLNLEKHGAMDYTIVVNASASEPAPFLYLAPYAGCAIGEFFMEQGKDVLIVYDDLSKHAVAYRTISLLLERSPGREAYPGDVFYLHSRLLERSAHLSDEKGGGSMTALPIAETQNGDVSAYIPTNIISITDGQIFLESDLFFSGQRPAVNVGLSVSRVGSAAQYPAVKKASGALRLSLAQYREIEVFSQFSSDLDDSTKNQLKFGADLMMMMRQPQYRPYKLHEQVILLVISLNHILQNVPTCDVVQTVRDMLDYFHGSYADLCAQMDRSKTMSDEDKAKILEIAHEFMCKSGR